MKPKANNYAFIDSQNVNLGVCAQGWKMDWKKFRVYLKDKYSVSEAYYFIGYVEKYEPLYKFLKESGFHCIFKPTLEISNGATKGNVDAELVLHTMIQRSNFEKAIIVSGDGDFYCLVEYLIKEKKFGKLLVPDVKKYSSLFNKLVIPTSMLIDPMNELRSKLEYTRKNEQKTEQKKRAPSGTNPFGNPLRRET